MIANESRPAEVDRAFRKHARRLWGIAYRLTGSAADADDIVQETFVRLAGRPPRASAPLGAWLVRVTVNLGIDALRRRRRRAYPGIWLPSPVELDALEEETPEESAGARYERLESASTAFLLAMEVLPPRRRAVLILCDVLDYSAAEAASVLGMTSANVRMALSRARRAMAAHDGARASHPAPSRAAVRRSLEAFLTALRTGDGAALEALLASEVRAMGDGGGEFASVPTPMVGRAQVKRFFVSLAAQMKRLGPMPAEIRVLNGMPAAVLRVAGARPPIPPVVVLQVDLDGAGHIAEIRSVMASRKLTALGTSGRSRPGAR